VFVKCFPFWARCGKNIPNGGRKENSTLVGPFFRLATTEGLQLGSFGQATFPLDDIVQVEFEQLSVVLTFELPQALVELCGQNQDVL
jgi:hypothetical protein